MSRVSCDSLVFGAKCVTVVIFRSLEVGRAVLVTRFARVSCDSLAFGAKCETVVIFRSLGSRVSCDSFVFGAKLDFFVFLLVFISFYQPLLYKTSIFFACIVRFACFRSKV